MNKKGFTLVEILTAITILGILSVIAIAGYTRYTEYAKEKSYKTMAKSMTTAAEQYIMDNPGDYMETEAVVTEEGTKYVFKDEEDFTTTFDSLMKNGYTNGAQDPNNKSSDCRGYVRIGLVKGDGKDALDQYIYQVDECCSNYSARYTYTFVKDENGLTKTKEEVDDTIDKAIICPARGKFNIVVNDCGHRTEKSYFFERGMNVIEWAHSNYSKEMIDEEIRYYDEDNETIRNSLKDDLGNMLYRYTSDCYEGGYGYDYGYGYGYGYYGPELRRNLEADPNYDECPIHVLEEGETILINYACNVQ